MTNERKLLLKYLLKEYKESLNQNIKFYPGMKCKIAGGSGIDSDKIVTIVNKNKIKTDGSGVPINVVGSYYKPINWNKQEAFQYENGKFGTMYKNRLIPLKQGLLKEDSNSIDLTTIKQKANQLNLKIKLKPIRNQQYDLFLYDTKSKFNTETFQFWKGSLDGKEFLDRVEELKKFKGNKVIFYNGNRVFIANAMIRVR